MERIRHTSYTVIPIKFPGHLLPDSCRVAAEEATNAMH